MRKSERRALLVGALGIGARNGGSYRGSGHVDSSPDSGGTLVLLRSAGKTAPRKKVWYSIAVAASCDQTPAAEYFRLRVRRLRNPELRVTSTYSCRYCGIRPTYLPVGAALAAISNDSDLRNRRSLDE